MLNRILLTTDAVGGVWRYSMELARGIAAQGMEIVLAVLGPAPDLGQRQEIAAIPGVRLLITGLPLDWLAETPDEIEFAAQVLAAVARQVDADTVQLHSPALVGHAFWPVPVMTVAHSCVGTWWRALRGGSLPSDLVWRAELTQLGISRADRVVAPSASFADALRACYNTLRPIEIILNGRTPMSGKAERRRQVLTVGRLWDEGKNVAALDAAAETLEWPVLAAGSAAGPNGARASCHHLQMLGSLKCADLATEYAKAAVFVSVARYEPFGLAVLEAAQAGCALVLSDIPTFRELWNGAAIFVPGNAPDQIADAISDLLRHPEILSQHGARAAQRAVEFDVRRMANATLAVHEQLTSIARTAA